MAVRVGVDVGGTFTKAVACDPESDAVLAHAVVPTTHASAVGVADGVREAIERVAGEVRARELGPIELVAHSTTQAVNALLEGDTARVGVLGIGARPHLRRARKRARVGEIGLAPGKRLETVHHFLDASGGVSAAEVAAALDCLVAQGATAVCVSQAFGVENGSLERMALGIAAGAGIPACAGHELSGLYGLELRTVTGAVNAGILPAALRAAEVVEAAVRREAGDVPLLVMRGDGGSADLRTMRSHPLLTAFSGPAASVCGALRHLPLRDGVMVEVGGTSTNVTVIEGGRPALAYVRVLDHVTCVRSLDVRVGGVAGGSLVRVKRRGRRLRLAGVGPRSAHIAGLPYACFAERHELEPGELRLIAPRPGDPEEYAVLDSGMGRRFALTPTCAANALDRVPAGAYSAGRSDSARVAFAAAARALGCDWRELAEEVLETAARGIAAIVRQAAADHELDLRLVVGVGGAAGALVPATARQLGVESTIPPKGEIISSIGDALSLIRVELEQSSGKATIQSFSHLHRQAEEAAIRAGAAPATVRTESEAVPDRAALRVVAHGSVALEADHLRERALLDAGALERAARELIGDRMRVVSRSDYYTVCAAPNGGAAERFAVLDVRGAVAAKGEGTVLAGTGEQVLRDLRGRVPSLTRQIGPFSVAPGVRIVRGTRLVDLTVMSKPDEVLAAAQEECRAANGDPVVALIASD